MASGESPVKKETSHPTSFVPVFFLPLVLGHLIPICRTVSSTVLVFPKMTWQNLIGGTQAENQNLAIATGGFEKRAMAMELDVAFAALAAPALKEKVWLIARFARRKERIDFF